MDRRKGCLGNANDYLIFPWRRHFTVGNLEQGKGVEKPLSALQSKVKLSGVNSRGSPILVDNEAYNSLNS
ncbi:hypothetical protein GOBAR_AA15446 [Gossypium barbadense]|uniref:Uncharacterized protein n=1 Tax=Gossypium barbadense TaxID=3634 RepID=A0A2P5XPE7_GOSBA|nr:hypothetical protein GOBAR_AA15446 [Gossypium barbadense]